MPKIKRFTRSEFRKSDAFPKSLDFLREYQFLTLVQDRSSGKSNWTVEVKPLSLKKVLKEIKTLRTQTANYKKKYKALVEVSKTIASAANAEKDKWDEEKKDLEEKCEKYSEDLIKAAEKYESLEFNHNKILNNQKEDAEHNPKKGKNTHTIRPPTIYTDEGRAQQPPYGHGKRPSVMRKGRQKASPK